MAQAGLSKQFPDHNSFVQSLSKLLVFIDFWANEVITAGLGIILVNLKGDSAMANDQTRPLSPHLGIYKPQLTSFTSIMHRVTGSALSLGSLGLVWWLMAVLAGGTYYETAASIMASPLGLLVLLGYSWALSYKMLSGLRHIYWDFTLKGLSPDEADTSSKAILVGSFALTAVIFFLGAV